MKGPQLPVDLDGRPTSQAMARSLGALYLCGASLTTVWVAIPHEGNGREVVTGLAAGAAAIGLVLIGGSADRAPHWLFHATIAAAQLFITVALVASGDPGNDIRFAYVWATPFAAFFFRPRTACAHAVWAAACLGAGMTVLGVPVPDATRIWVMTIGAVAAVGTLVVWAATSVRRREQALHDAATHDPLTGLPNRTLFARLARAALDRRRAHGGNVFVVLADLDRFKVVNDTHGHHAGDQLLVELAPRLQAALPDGAVVARMGGDEFAVLVHDPVGSLDPQVVVDRLTAAWERPVPLERGALYTSACLGLAVAGDGDTPSSLLRDADAAMYDAKRAGSGSARVFDSGHRTAAMRRYQLEQALHTAIAEERLHLVYQPVVDTATGRMVGAEALLRWDHPTLGPVGPGEFVPVAEETGLIGQIGAWVLERAVGQLGQWAAEELLDERFQLGVNVSAHQLDDRLPDTVERLVRRAGVETRRLIVEVTESALIHGQVGAARSLDALRDLGIGLALDDFGTGFSSLTALRQGHFDAVKIDRTFVADLVDGTHDGTVVAAVMALVHGLGLDAVAEGVETHEQAAVLHALGCRVAQGYLYDPPLPIAQFERRLEHLRAAHAA